MSYTDAMAREDARRIIRENAGHLRSLVGGGCTHDQHLGMLLLALVGWGMEDLVNEIWFMDLVGLDHE